MNNFDILMAMMFNNMNRNLINLNFYFTANKHTYTIKVNTKERIWQYLYRFSVNEKELNDINIFSVIFNNSKLDIDTQISELEIKEGDTITVESEFPSKDNTNDNSVKNYIKPFSDSELQGVYEGDLKNGKPEGNGREFHIMGFAYKGEWKSGQKNGQGIERGPQGEVYKGEFKDDKRNGKGISETADGEIYEGDWLNGKKHGKGKTTYPNGDKYEGDFQNGLPNGKGKIIWTNGNEYEGEMKDDLMHGKGILKSNAGDIYEGDFLQDKMTGKGIFKYINGNIYEGEFLNNAYNGKGTLFYKDGSKYEGDWKDNKKHGKGIFKFNNGDVYEGEFMNNSIDGFGKKTYADGRIEEGLWEINKFMEDYKDDGSLECIKSIDCQDKAVKMLLELQDGRLLSALRDGTINIYKKDSYEIDLSIKAHSKDINSAIQLSDERILTCSEDNTMKVIKLTDDNKYIIESSLESHDNEVLNAIEIKNNEIISVSLDKTLKVWDLKTFKVITTIEEECVNIIKINESEFITISPQNKCIKFWNNYQIIKTINDLKVQDLINSTCFFGNNKLFIGADDIIYLIDIEKKELIKSFEMFGYVLSISNCLDGDILCTLCNGNKNNHISKYHYDNENLIKIFEKKKVHNNPIFNCIQLKNGNIVSGDRRGQGDLYEIKFWKILKKNN